MARNRTLVSAVLILAGAAGSAHAQFAHLVLSSQPGDFIGQGQNWNIFYTPAEPGSFSTSVIQTIGGAPSNIDFVLGNVTGGSDNTFSILQFSTEQLGLALHDGTFLDAQRAAFAGVGHPGLDVSFQNRGSNTLTGSFAIKDFQYSFNQTTNQYTILKFDASFVQHSEGGTPALTGTFSYNAVPEPASMAALGLGAFGLLSRRRKKS